MAFTWGGLPAPRESDSGCGWRDARRGQTILYGRRHAHRAGGAWGRGLQVAHGETIGQRGRPRIGITATRLRARRSAGLLRPRESQGHRGRVQRGDEYFTGLSEAIA